MLPEEIGATIIKKHKITQLSDAIQKFYNGASFQVTIRNKGNLEEIIQALNEAYKRQN